MKSMHTRSLAVSRPRPGQESSEPVQHSPLPPDRSLGPASIPQHRHDTADAFLDACLFASRITSASGSGMNRQVILRRCEQRPAAPRASPRHPLIGWLDSLGR